MLYSQKITKIFHADRHRLFRDGVKSFIEDHPFIIVGEADNTSDLFTGIIASNPDLLIISHRLYDGDTIDFLPLLSEKFPDLKILMLTMVAERNYLKRCMGFLHGMISKELDKEGVLKAINAVVNNRIYFVIPETSQRLKRK